MVGGMSLSARGGGEFRKTQAYLERLQRNDLLAFLDRFGQEGVIALANATPVRSGLSAASWSYEVTTSRGGAGISWHNTNLVDGTPVVILIQYGHGTGTGGYVAGFDFINPVILPIFERIKTELRKAVKA